MVIQKKNINIYIEPEREREMCMYSNDVPINILFILSLLIWIRCIANINSQLFK